MPGEGKRVPPGDFALFECVDDETLPGVVLQHQVGEQRIVRWDQFLRRRAEGFKKHKRIGGEKGSISYDHRCKEQQRLQQ